MKFILLALLAISANAFSKPHYGRGLVKPVDADKKAVFLSPSTVAELPEEYDLRKLGFVSPVRNQGGCGSCWAFGTTDATESNALVQGGPSLFLSTQHLVNCLFYGCGGGYFAFDYIQKKGVTDAATMPYQGRDGRCKENFDKKYFASSWYRIGSANRSPTSEEVKTAIFKYGAVAVTVAADGSWDNYRGGVKQSCRKSQTNHIVTLVGWDKNNVFILKNSWSKNWGDQGYGYFPFGCNYAGSEEAAVGVFNNQKLFDATKDLIESGASELSTEDGVLSVVR